MNQRLGQDLAMNYDPTQPVAVEPRDGFRIWIKFRDGEQGEIDLSDVAGRGVFTAWDDRSYFERVHISEYRSIAWDDELELCPDALYMELTGISWEDFKELSSTRTANV